MFIPKQSRYKHFNRFGQINPGKMDWRFWAARQDDPTPKPDEKFTLDEAKAKLKEQGHVVMLQKAFDGIINDKYTDAYEKAKKEYNGQDSEALKVDNEKLKTQIEELKKGKGDMIPKAEHEALLNAEKDKTKQALDQVGSLKKHQLDNALLKTISNKAVDPSDVLALTRDRFQLDENGKIFVVNEKGEKVVDGEGDGYQTPERFFDKFFKEKPHLAKASDSKGAGSGASNEGNNGGSSNSNSLDALVGLDQAGLAKALGMGS